MSIDFYNTHADDFYQSTVNIDVSPLLRRFIPYLPASAHILDAGCGSGRDSKTFIDQGFQVTAIDASEELGKRAEIRLKQFITNTNLSIKETWITSDLRPDRKKEQWLNVILVKNND
ncbi:class I SAM-dependent methyltransferase [Photobacterium angustum]|uniref:class I SAM-dependent methyltransferase n=1 Tax=Photobacterium angustum TaxID=661 RepID=UPI0005E28D0A|nr:class I SAM-dependent methyltransferase [Photobacterium angustum]KJG02112.1 hypothetical protein UB35_08105 [Photobacterium angustum]PSV65845.1 class I SAM-dependent methyltransferase [Photobacterium angustum]